MLEEYLNKYDVFVKSNPRLSAEIEAIIRWSSYLVATRKSPVLGELLSSGANLLQLCNDIILRQANSELKLSLENCATQLKTFLSVIQSLELLAEIYARESYGVTGKWAIITVIQITKATIKLILLLVFDDGLTKSQSIVPLDRLHYAEILKLQERFDASKKDDSGNSSEGEQVASANETPKNASKSVVLKSSGRRMRSITESPPKSSRFFQGSKNVTDASNPFNNLQRKRLTMLLDRYKEHKSATLTERQLYGELLHISRPLAHLALMGAFGTKSWISYLTSMAMDMSSLYLVRSPFPLGLPLNRQGEGMEPQALENYHFNMNERMELGQRASSLLLYLLRSPFFDEYTKQRALEGLATSAESIPLLGGFISTFVNYIPDWQKDYFRVWSE